MHRRNALISLTKARSLRPTARAAKIPESGRRRSTGRRLREGGRARGMEGDVAFNLLHHLVDVAVEHGHRAETLQVAERLR